MATTFDMNDLKRRMQGAITSLKQELSGLRTGRASSALLDHVQVEAYGNHMPLNQLATISVPEPRLLNVQVWDRSQIHAVEKAISAANLGLSPSTEGQVLKLRIPELNEERRKEIVKVAHKYAEAARVAVRHVRRDGLDVLKKSEKDHQISEDEHTRQSGEVQKVTDATIAEVDKLLDRVRAAWSRLVRSVTPATLTCRHRRPRPRSRWRRPWLRPAGIAGIAPARSA